MKVPQKTDYSQIAIKYDNNEYRKRIHMDNELKKCIEIHSSNSFNFLDLSCGTGLYLTKQIEYFKEYDINWFGLDISPDMLAISKSKIEEKATFDLGNAEQLPYSSNFFHFISNNFAFHHYLDKGKALDEIGRVLIKNGTYKMHNIAIHDMMEWWIYVLFPSAYKVDMKRFWDKDQIFSELQSRGFDVKLEMNYKKETTKIADFIEYIRNRDISVLTLISQNDFEEGIKKMETMIQMNKDATIIHDFSIVDIIATKI